MPPRRKSLLSLEDRRTRKIAQRKMNRQRKSEQSERTELNIRIFDPSCLLPKLNQQDTIASSYQPFQALDRAFQQEVLRDLNSDLETPPSHGRLTWGIHTAVNVRKYLLEAKPPTSKQVHFLSEEKAAEILSSHTPVTVPIFVASHDTLPWETHSSRIFQTLNRFNSSDTVSVNMASILTGGGRKENASAVDISMERLKTWFKSPPKDGDSWNVLDLCVPFPDTWGTCPKFLQNTNCSLLSHLKRQSLSSGSAARPFSTGHNLQWREIERWLILASPGSNTMTHQDSYGYETFINTLEGEIGFAWLDRPSQEELRVWAEATFDFEGGRWCFVVLRPGMTVFFQSGTVHLVVRRRNGESTLGVGGHILRYSNIQTWVQSICTQLKYPNATNEEVTPEKAAHYLGLTNRLISHARAEGDLQLFGGEDGVELYAKEVEIFCNILENEVFSKGLPKSGRWKAKLAGLRTLKYLG